MLTSPRHWILAIAVALYLYFLLPATADMLFSLYHLTQFGPLYWGYSGFKAAGYFLGVYEHKLLACLLLAAAIIVVPMLYRAVRRG